MADQRLNQAPPHVQQRRKWYGLARWKRIRATVLRDNPRCAICGIARATQADHIVHTKDNARFWDIDNLRPSCAPCNNRLGATAHHARPGKGHPIKAAGGWGKTSINPCSTAPYPTERDTPTSREALFANLMARARGDA